MGSAEQHNMDKALERMLREMRNQPWPIRLKRWARVKWYFVRLDICGGYPFCYIDSEGNESQYFKRPLLARLLFGYKDGN